MRGIINLCWHHEPRQRPRMIDVIIKLETGDLNATDTTRSAGDLYATVAEPVQQTTYDDVPNATMQFDAIGISSPQTIDISARPLPTPSTSTSSTSTANNGVLSRNSSQTQQQLFETTNIYAAAPMPQSADIDNNNNTSTSTATSTAISNHNGFNPNVSTRGSAARAPKICQMCNVNKPSHRVQGVLVGFDHFPQNGLICPDCWANVPEELKK